MPDETMQTTDTRLDAALLAMREPPAVDRQHIERIAARAVLDNAPAARATTWMLRAAAAIAIVTFGAAALTSARQAATAERALIAMADSGALLDATTPLTPVMATAARPIVFELDAPTAESVQVLGDFNQWSRDTNIMRRGSDGRWRMTTMLPPGRYVYTFLVDGERFQRDPLRDAIEDRDFGVTGSELVVGEAP
jgi:Glycogen recognition site of AMP-activated protein kinase